MWQWQAHEVAALQENVRAAIAGDGRPIFLWAWDNVCLAHTKRRAIAVDETADETMVTTVPENAGESLAGLKSTLRMVLHAIPKGLKLSQLQSAFRDKTGQVLDDVLALSLGFGSVDQLMAAIPDAVRREGDRFTCMREATRHEITTLALTNAGMTIRDGATFLVDAAGEISECPPIAAAGSVREAKQSRLPLSAYLPYDDSVVYEDLTEMQKIHLPSLLLNIESRFQAEKIYTYIANMLLAVNPYKALTMPLPGHTAPVGLYEAETRAYYAGLGGDTRQKSVCAHVFVVADNAFRALGAERLNQSVVISGESGAGKTKSAREVLRYIVEVSTGALDRAGREGVGSVSLADRLVAKITQNNPVLEAFGNAKTVRNDNSSRFGKYLELVFDAPGRLIVGAQIQTYLLEKVCLCVCVCVCVCVCARARACACVRACVPRTRADADPSAGKVAPLLL